MFGFVLALGSRGLSLFLFRSCSGLVPFLVVFRSYSSSVGGSVPFRSGSVGVRFCVFGVPVLFVFWVLVLFLVLFMVLFGFLGVLVLVLLDIFKFLLRKKGWVVLI